MGRLYLLFSQAIEKSNVVIFLVDASEGVTDQDATLLGMVLEAGRALVIGLNKWDGLSVDQKKAVRKQIDLNYRSWISLKNIRSQN